MGKNVNLESIFNWAFGVLLVAIGVLNLLLVHPVPGIAYFLLACIYLPPASFLLRKWFDFTVPLLLKILFGLVILLFTLGVSDVGDMLDKW
ncbi:hypothetical protein [Rufibacter quisquiliarum]|uniref:Uncharacterized protein n=1 Tax=Rufibacter quisquiliarum TaxID=1549639 RepID=A0A839GG67_9BACT|nr:hypothetical protein [Rufibacter quisquiliarum]MBA9078654.1 hypothetical protein [Rufibacter quisquiliarum]